MDPEVHIASEPEVGVVNHPDGPVGGGRNGPDDVPDSARPSSMESHSNRWLIEWVVILVAVIAFTFVLRTFVVQTFIIPSGSMLPTLQIGDRITVDKLSYDLHGVHRGDIVVFKRPPKENCGGPSVPDLVKRVIGLPGEKISSSGNAVLIDGKPINEPWFSTVPLGPSIRPQPLPADHYFVMGDNRSDSCDSRYWGTIPRSLIVGRAFAVVWPLSQIKGL